MTRGGAGIGIVRNLTACLGAVALLAACVTPAARAFEPGGGRVMHTVVFWLSADAPAGTADELRALYRERVPQVPGVVSVFVAPPRPSERSVVDDSFTLAASTLFVDSAAEQAWQSHPIHAELKSRFDRYIENVAIYDAIE